MLLPNFLHSINDFIIPRRKNDRILNSIFKILHNAYNSRMTETTLVPKEAGECSHGGGKAPCPFKKGSTGAYVPFNNSVVGISWFIKIDLKQIYCSYSHTQKIQNGFP